MGKLKTVLGATLGLSLCFIAAKVIHDTGGVTEQAASTAGEPSRAYERDYFGPSWQDTDGNGCDQRDDVLRRDAEGFTPRGRCEVSTIVLDDPYTGMRLTAKSDIDIDHVVSLSGAWDLGAWAWTDERRLAFATDLDNLVAVDDGENRRKSDKGPARWRPPNHDAWCSFSATYLAVSSKYDLPVGQADGDALAEMKATC